MFEAFDASASGLRAERVRLTAIANNVANYQTTRNEFGEREPFRRRLVTLMPGNLENSDPSVGVTVDEIIEDDAAAQLVYDPTHPDRMREEDFFTRDANGAVTAQRRPEYAELSDGEFAQERARLIDKYVRYPNVNVEKEMADAVLAARAYEANVAVIEVSKSLIGESLSIIA